MQIGTITFTDREIDIICCILNSRRVKKIANILCISPRTVETHIQNILTKIGRNSQESIIDFIEKSGKLQLIKERYLNLLITSTFEQQLKQLSYLTRGLKLSCSIICNEKEFKDNRLQKLVKHLKIVGLKVEVKNNDDVAQNLKDTSSHNIYLLSQENIDHLILAGSFEIKKGDIFLVKDNSAQILISKKSLSIDVKSHIINFTEEQYYHNVFHILKEFIGNIDFNKFLSEFQALRNNIINSKGDNNLADLFFDTSQPMETNKVKTLDEINTLKLDYLKSVTKILPIGHFFTLLATIICIVTFTCLVLKYNLQEIFLRSKQVNFNDHTLSPLTYTNPELAKFLSTIQNIDFSADNITQEQAQKNHSLIKQVEHIVDIASDKQIQECFYDTKIPPKELFNYLYLLQSLANYYMYNEYNGVKAWKLLNFAKKLLEHYIQSKSNITLDFTQLSEDELYSELAAIKELPEIYTRIIYFLGRTYIYQDNKLKGERYFKISEYLGKKLGLFEEHLSQRNGLGIIKKEQIITAINHGHYNEVRKDILALIELYKKLKTSTKQYKVEYKPGQKFNRIIPKDDIYNQVECAEQIIQLYTKLITINSDHNLEPQYIKEILDQLLGNKDTYGILLKVDQLPRKKIASVYNTLGNMLLQLYDQKINCDELKNKIVDSKFLVVEYEKKQDILKFIEQLFEFAKANSRSDYFTKADSYNGLAKVYYKMLKQHKVSELEKQQLLKKLAVLRSNIDKINLFLNREQKR